VDVVPGNFPRKIPGTIPPFLSATVVTPPGCAAAPRPGLPGRVPAGGLETYILSNEIDGIIRWLPGRVPAGGLETTS